MTQVTPERLAETVRRLTDESDFDVTAFWMRVDEDRSSYGAALRVALADVPAAVFVVREPSFDNANTVLMDLVTVIEANRADCLAGLGNPAGQRCAIVLLARNELSVPQASSPVTLPEWFPDREGMSVYTSIQDLTWTADAPLDGPELLASDLSAAAYALQSQLLRQLERVHQSDHRHSNGLFSLLRRESDGDLKYDDLLAQWKVSHQSVQSETAFRPSVRNGASLVARLWGLSQATTPDRLARAAKQFASALDLDVGILERFPPAEPLLAVLAQPSGGSEAAGQAFGRITLVAVAASARLITTAAHADDYPRYPVALLRAVSFDLRRSLRSLAVTLDRAYDDATG